VTVGKHALSVLTETTNGVSDGFVAERIAKKAVGAVFAHVPAIEGANITFGLPEHHKARMSRAGEHAVLDDKMMPPIKFFGLMAIAEFTDARVNLPVWVGMVEDGNPMVFILNVWVRPVDADDTDPTDYDGVLEAYKLAFDQVNDAVRRAVKEVRG
jgi:hypothetical protein